MAVQAKSFAVCIEHDGASINGVLLGRAGPVSQFHAFLGRPDRIGDPSETPAPVGHRNNQLHYYDAQGVILNEHHYTHQIHEIKFVLDTEFAIHSTTHPFHGTMTLGGLALRSGMLERDLSQSNLPFTAQLPGTWFTSVRSPIDGEQITVAVSTVGPKLKSGRRSKTKVITTVSLCLPNDPWDTTSIPSRSQ